MIMEEESLLHFRVLWVLIDHKHECIHSVIVQKHRQYEHMYDQYKYVKHPLLLVMFEILGYYPSV